MGSKEEIEAERGQSPRSLLSKAVTMFLSLWVSFIWNGQKLQCVAGLRAPFTSGIRSQLTYAPHLFLVLIHDVKEITLAGLNEIIIVITDNVTNLKYFMWVAFRENFCSFTHYT